MRKDKTPGDAMQEHSRNFLDIIFQNIRLKKDDSRKHIREQWKTEITQKTVMRKSNSTKPFSIAL